MKVTRRIFMTEKEKERNERNTLLCDKYRALKSRYPDVPKSRLLSYMHKHDETGGMSINSCYQILKRFNIQ